MTVELRLGNPLRVACRACKAAPGNECSGPSLSFHTRRFHGSRVKDAFREWKRAGSPVIAKEPKKRTGRRPHHASLPVAMLGDLAPVERAVSKASRTAKDMQTPEFWRSVWSED